MDVIGRNATTKEGEYFRNNVWWWRPLAEYIIEVAPDIAKHCQHWGTNDGDGLNAAQSIMLADALQIEIDSGRAERYRLMRVSVIEMMPDEQCDLCEGTGVRKAVPQAGAGDLRDGGIKCNGCDGKGFKRPWAASYPFSVENVQEFVTFLRGSGGFKIL